MILHVVLLDPANDPALAQIKAAMNILTDLTNVIPGFLIFRHGPNRDFEAKSERYTYGFACTFANRKALDAYAAHPDHQRAGGMLVMACRDGHDGIFVADLEV